MRLILIAAAIAVSIASAQAQCVQALIQDRSSFDFRQASTLALMKLASQSRSSQSKTGVGVTVPIYGVPVQGSYDNARKSMESYFENSKINWTDDRVISVATQTLSKNAVEAYKACINGSRRNGTMIVIHDAQPNQVTIEVKWSAPPGAPSTATGTVSLSGGRLLTPFPTTWVSNGVTASIIQRSPREDLRIIANIGNDSANEFVAYIPPVDLSALPPPPPVRAAQLFLGVVPNRNQGEVTDNPAHKGGRADPYGFSIQQGPRAGAGLFVGITPNINAGIMNTGAGSWRGGATKPFGYVVAPGKEAPGDFKLWVGRPGTPCAGAVSNFEGHQHCAMDFLGYAAANPD